MSDSFKINTMCFKELARKLSSSSLREKVMNVPRERALAAQIGQAIADNFSSNGPGWAPLKLRKGQPLQKTGLLRNSVTTPGAQYNINQVNGTTLSWGTKLAYAGIHNKGGTISPKNSKALFIPISAKGKRIGPQKEKSAQKKSGLVRGKDFVLARSVTVPKREFLVLRPQWKRRIATWMAERYEAILRQDLLR